jgi:hypothetical protein
MVADDAGLVADMGALALEGGPTDVERAIFAALDAQVSTETHPETGAVDPIGVAGPSMFCCAIYDGDGADFLGYVWFDALGRWRANYGETRGPDGRMVRPAGEADFTPAEREMETRYLAQENTVARELLQTRAEGNPEYPTGEDLIFAIVRYRELFGHCGSVDFNAGMGCHYIFDSSRFEDVDCSGPFDQPLRPGAYDFTFSDMQFEEGCLCLRCAAAKGVAPVATPNE